VVRASATTATKLPPPFYERLVAVRVEDCVGAVSAKAAVVSVRDRRCLGNRPGRAPSRCSSRIGCSEATRRRFPPAVASLYMTAAWYQYETLCAGCGKPIEPGAPRITSWANFPYEDQPGIPEHSWHDLDCLDEHRRQQRHRDHDTAPRTPTRSSPGDASTCARAGRPARGHARRVLHACWCDRLHRERHADDLLAHQRTGCALLGWQGTLARRLGHLSR
jgi:hypothetical protein